MTTMANIYRATEFDLNTMKQTGRTEHYLADGLTQAVNSCLYTHRLHNGNAKLGPAGLVVFCGGLAYSITPEK